jgi:hypothetical protein
MLSVIMLSVIMLSVIMLSVIMLSVIMQNVVMLNVVAPYLLPILQSKILKLVLLMNYFIYCLFSWSYENWFHLLPDCAKLACYINKNKTEF